jgi:hypothetical protein
MMTGLEAVNSGCGCRIPGSQVAAQKSEMQTEARTKEQLIIELHELHELHEQVAELEKKRAAEEFIGFGGKVLVNLVSKEKEAAIQELLDGVGEGGD